MTIGISLFPFSQPRPSLHARRRRQRVVSARIPYTHAQGGKVVGLDPKQPTTSSISGPNCQWTACTVVRHSKVHQESNKQRNRAASTSASRGPTHLHRKDTVIWIIVRRPARRA